MREQPKSTGTEAAYRRIGHALRAAPAGIFLPQVVRFQVLRESGLEFEAVYYVLSPDYDKRMDIPQAINLALLQRFASTASPCSSDSHVVWSLECESGAGASSDSPLHFGFLISTRPIPAVAELTPNVG